MDIVGIGALNVDYIATRSRLEQWTRAEVSEFAGQFEKGTERIASDRQVREVKEQLGLGDSKSASAARHST